MTVALRYAARSHVGLLREGNEDALYAGPGLLAIADGMGGHVAGEVASSVVIDTMAGLDTTGAGELLRRLDSAVRAANDRLRDLVRRDPRLDGMGTTLTALRLDPAGLGLVHIGDSRGYRLRDGELVRITHDHSFVQSLVDEGRITEDQALHHPQRSLILRALDGRSDIEPDLTLLDPLLGDRYLLCTDGLTDVVSDATIRATLGDGTPQEACDQLVDLALRAGGPDNVTCIVAEAVDDGGSTEAIWDGAVAQPSAAGAAHPATAEHGGTAAQAGAGPHDASPDGAAQAADPSPGPAGTARRRRRLGRPLAGGLALLLLLAAGVFGAWSYVRAQYYVAAAGGQVAIFRGVSGSFLGVNLSTVHATSGIRLDQLPQYQRGQVTRGIDAAGLADARRIVDRLRASGGGACTPGATPSAAASAAAPGPSPSSAAGTPGAPSLAPCP